MATVSADHQSPMDRAGSRVHSGHATVLADQTRNPQPCADIDTRRNRRVDEQRIEGYPPNAQTGLEELRFVERRLDAHDIVDHHRQAIQWDRPGRQNRIEDTKPVQHLHSTRLDQVSRRCLRRKLGTVDQADAQTRRASINASGDPAHRAPTITTSNRVMPLLCERRNTHPNCDPTQKIRNW